MFFRLIQFIRERHCRRKVNNIVRLRTVPIETAVTGRLNNYVHSIGVGHCRFFVQTGRDALSLPLLLFRTRRGLYPARESNQTFMLNHETIRTESANKRAPFRSPISPPLKPFVLVIWLSYLLVLGRTKSWWTFRAGQKALDWARERRGWPLAKRSAERVREGDAAVCKFLGLARGRDRAGFRGEFAWATHLRPAATFANVLLIALVY